MTNGEAVNWIINISADIGKAEHRDLWHYEQALSEIREMLEPVQSEIIRCKDCKHIQTWRSEESAKKFGQIYECARSVLNCPKPEDFCSYAEMRGEKKNEQILL